VSNRNHLFGEPEFHDSLSNLVGHVHLLQVLEDPDASVLFVDEVILPFPVGMFGESFAQSVAITAVKLDTSAVINQVNLRSRRHHEDGTTSFCDACMVAEFPFLLLSERAKERGVVGLKLQLTRLPVAAVVLHEETKYFTAEQTDRILLHLRLAISALAIVIVLN